MKLTFAETSLADDTLSVRFTYEPCKYDLKILLIQWWLPMMLAACIVVSAFFWFKTPVPAEQACAGITLLCATVLYQIIRRSFDVAAYQFDRFRDLVSRNSVLVSQFSETEIVLQTRLGWQGNRRFRLILKRKEKPDIILTETPLLGDETRMQRYYGRTHAENVQTMFDGWVADKGRRDAVDERDIGILALAKTLENFMKQRVDHPGFSKV